MHQINVSAHASTNICDSFNGKQSVINDVRLRDLNIQIQLNLLRSML